MKKTISISKARIDLPKIVDRVDRLWERYVITVNGESKAIVMSSDDYDSLHETLDILSEPQALKDIKQAEKEFRQGKTASWEKIKKDLKINV